MCHIVKYKTSKIRLKLENNLGLFPAETAYYITHITGDCTNTSTTYNKTKGNKYMEHVTEGGASSIEVKVEKFLSLNRAF